MAKRGRKPKKKLREIDKEWVKDEPDNEPGEQDRLEAEPDPDFVPDSDTFDALALDDVDESGDLDDLYDYLDDDDMLSRDI